jgi:transitional endoplasmic reticulum ATPase
MASSDIAFDLTFDGFKSHCNGSRTSTRLQVLESLRNAYPCYHVTCVDKLEYDFEGFAKQGHAKSHLFTQSHNRDREFIDAKRRYDRPSRLVESASGSLYDNVFFGRYEYDWDDKSFILYKGNWNISCVRDREEVFFVLAPRVEATILDGHCSSTDALLLAVGKWTSVPHDEIYVFDQTYWSKSAELWNNIKGSSWDDVILDSKMKASLIEDVQGFFDNRDLYRQFSVPWKRGIILHGVPGNGKTISIKALINYLYQRDDPVPSLYVKSFEDKCRGPQVSVKDIFDHARKMAPCLLVFEDLDSLVSKDVRSYFLNEVDGLDSNDGILMIGSTNHLNSLDPAISKRPSRFDRKYHFQVPSFTEREAYVDYWRTKLDKNTSIHFEEDIIPIVATLTDGFSYAYLKELFVMTLLIVARGGKGLEEPADNGWDVISEGSTPAEKTDSNSTSEDEKVGEEGVNEQDLAPPKKRKEVPAVDIPEHLRENVFLRVIHQQVRVLIHEMDNSEDDDGVTSALSGDGSEASKPDYCAGCVAMRRQIRAIAAAQNNR